MPLWSGFSDDVDKIEDSWEVCWLYYTGHTFDTPDSEGAACTPGCVWPALVSLHPFRERPVPMAVLVLTVTVFGPCVRVSGRLYEWRLHQGSAPLCIQAEVCAVLPSLDRASISLRRSGTFTALQMRAKLYLSDWVAFHPHFALVEMMTQSTNKWRIRSLE